MSNPEALYEIHSLKVNDTPSFCQVTMNRKPCPRRIFTGANHRATDRMHSVRAGGRKYTRFMWFGLWLFSNVKIRRFPAQSVLALSLSCRARVQRSSYTPCLLWLLPKLGSLLRFFEQHGQNVEHWCILLIHYIRVRDELSFYWITMRRKPCTRRIFTGANCRATARVHCLQTDGREYTCFMDFEL